MKCTKTVGVCFAGLLALSIILPANGGILAGNPYKPIASRNVFALNAASLPQPPAQSPVPLARISLTGLTTILGPPNVLFKVSNPAEPAKEGKSYILEEGQIQNDIGVISIDMKKCVVVFRNHGVIQKISFESGAINASETKAPPVPSTL